MVRGLFYVLVVARCSILITVLLALRLRQRKVIRTRVARKIMGSVEPTWTDYCKHGKPYWLCKCWHPWNEKKHAALMLEIQCKEVV